MAEAPQQPPGHGPTTEPPTEPPTEPSSEPSTEPSSETSTVLSAGSTDADPRAFSRLLSGARVRLTLLGLLETAFAATTGATIALCLALFVVGVAPFSIALRFALLALVAAGGVVGLVAAGRKLLALRHDIVVGARLEDALARRGTSVGDAVRAAVELSATTAARDDVTLGRSRSLADAHIAHTAQRVREGGALSSLPGVALERAVPVLVVGACAAFVVLVWSMGANDHWRDRWEKLFDDAGVERALEQRAASLLPLVTDLKLTLRFPAYMTEADEVIPGSSGDVTAPRGTEVIVEGRADRALEKASLLVSSGGDREVAAEVKPDGRTVVARFVVDAGGSYRFKLDGVRGGAELDPVAHKITLHADAAPSVSLDEPSLDKTVKLEDTIELAFSARDDVGLTKMRVVVKRQGSARDPYVKDLVDVPGALREARGTGAFDIADSGARPGDKLSVYIEALDNDTVSGPNVGRSQTRVLTVYSAAEQHRTVIQRLEEVMSRMVDSLGDELESPMPASLALDEARKVVERHDSIATRHAAMQKALDEALLALAEDEMSPPPTRRALANMKLKVARAVESKATALKAVVVMVARNVAPARGVTQRATAAQEGIVERLEQDILYLEDLLNREKIAEARQIAEDLKRAQEDLKALIDQFKKTGDEATRKALLDEIQRMRKQMNELLSRLAELQRDIPDEHLNAEAFKGDELLADAQDIDKLIEEGKLDEAAKQLEKMLESTKKLVEDLDKTGEQYGGDEYKELREKMQRFADDLEALTKGQDDALDQSQSMMDKARREAEQRLKGKLDKALNDVKKKVEKAKAELAKLDKDVLIPNENEDSAFAKARVDDLEKALESKDLDDASNAAEEAEAAARSAERSVSERTKGRFGQKDKETLEQRAALEQARKELEEARKQLQQLLPDPSATMDKNDRDRLARTADQQQQLEENAERLERLMDEIGKEAPVFGPEHKQRLQDARDAMQRAGREMRSQNLRGARSSQRQALRQLSELGKDLAEMGKGQGQPGGMMGMGMPLPLPRGGSPGAEDSEQESDRGRSAGEDVKIPDGSEFKVPDAYRKDILDAMREGVPEGWAGEVKRYYEKLIK